MKLKYILATMAFVSIGVATQTQANFSPAVQIAVMSAAANNATVVATQPTKPAPSVRNNTQTLKSLRMTTAFVLWQNYKSGNYCSTSPYFYKNYVSVPCRVNSI